tara:strand:+ start:356 stop:625 length:270 start_codon:yes stop_codon:yes gene_type:complete
MFSYVLSFCKCPNREEQDPFDFEYDEDTIAVLREIYNNTEADAQSEEEDSSDSDYETDEDMTSDYSDSEEESEEVIVKRDIKSGLFYLF